MSELEFVPQMIGKQDTETHQKIHEFYETLMNRAETLRWSVEDFLQVPEYDVKLLLDLLKYKKSDLTTFLKHKFVESHNISIPGIDPIKLADSDLLALPDEFNTILGHITEMNAIVDKIELTRFEFPLTHLFSENDGWKLTDEFESELFKFTTTFTEDEGQNKIIEIVQRFCDVVNDLIAMKAIKGQGNLWMNVGAALQFAIKNDHLSDKPLSPSTLMFKRTPFNRFAKKAPFRASFSNRNNVLC